MSARVTIDLDALGSNFRALRGYSACGAVVKADAYGLGAQQVASCLQALGCQDFFVALPAEGERLREVLPRTCRIHVFAGATADSAPGMQNHALQPVLNTPSQLESWRRLGNGLPCNIHIDTGMARLGIPWSEVETTDFSELNVKYVLTHMACADEPEHPFNAVQLDRFERVLAQFPGVAISLGNSASMLAGFHHRFDRPHLGRPGIALYGGNPFSDRPNPMQPVAFVEAQVLQVRRLPAGEPSGYGATFVANQPTDVATLGMGYADGLPRTLSNVGQFAAGPVRCPILGRVSMDLVQVDVTGLSLAEGDWLELFGREISLDEMAACAGSFSYEALTRLGPRVERIYHQSGVPDSGAGAAASGVSGIS